VASAFYEAGKARQVANTLLLGWGYSFYRTENQLRADDQMVCAKAAWLLGQAAASVQAAEAQFRRVRIAPPSRANPFPDPQVMASAQSLERLGAQIVAVEARLHSLPAPAQDLMTLRFRQEADTLQKLVESDEILVGQSEMLRSVLDGRDAEWILENAGEIEAGLQAIQDTLRSRQAILMDGPAT
jgi:hypothetical protein